MKVLLDAGYFEHPKLRLVGPAIALFNLNAILFAHRNLTDGHIRPDDLTEIVEPLRQSYVVVDDVRRPTLFGSSAPIADVLDEVVERLTDAALWDVSSHGWVIHDYADYQPTRADLATAYNIVLRQREQAAERKSRWRDRRRERSPDIGNVPGERSTDQISGSSSVDSTISVSSALSPADAETNQDSDNSAQGSPRWFASQLRGSDARTAAAISSVVRQHELPEAALHAALEVVRERKPRSEPGYFIRCLQGYGKAGTYA